MFVTRRQFLRKMLSLLATFPIIGVVACRKDNGLDNELVGEKCTTSDDILGPFYRGNAPSRTDLNVNQSQGTALKISGSIYGIDCVTPLENARIEIWHADDAGEYDNTSDDFEFRGIVHSDTNGNYEFSTILPGRYLNGSVYRPSHIHFRITADGHRPLITQLYFEGDPFIDTDPWASHDDAEERIISLDEDSQGNQSGIFDVKMTPA